MRSDQSNTGGIDLRIVSRLTFVLLLAIVQCNFQQKSKEDSYPPFVFEQGSSALDIPFRIVDDLIVISAKLNDSIIVDLFLDTGFGNDGILLFNTEIGKKLNLNYVTQMPLGGGGDEETKIANVAQGVSLSLEGIKFNNLQTLVVTEKEDFEDLPVDGIIGRTLFNCILEIDYDKGHINLYDPNLEISKDLGTEFNLSFTYGVPVVEGEVLIDKESIPVKLIVDTGAGLPFFLFTYSNTKIRIPGNCISAKNEGLSGIMSYKLGRVKYFKIGEFVFDNPLTAFLEENSMGTASVLGQNGFVGHQTLQKFNVVFDYSGNKMFLRPNNQYLREFEFNMAGLVLKTRPDGKIIVFDVVENSPAWQENIKPGDLITAIKDEDVSRLSFTEIYKLFSQEGEKTKLTLQRKSKQFDCLLTLKRII
jgi:hypothetical protein